MINEFQKICDLLDAPSAPERRRLMKELVATQHYSVATAYRRINIVRSQRVADALIRSVRSDKGRLRLTPLQRATARKRLDQLRFVAEHQSIPQILVRVNGDLRQAGEAEISLRSLYNIQHELKTRKQLLESQGRKDMARDHYGSRAGELPDADFPLAVVQIDHTTCQIIFVDEEFRERIGDAWLTLVIDCFSRMVLGYYLSFAEPSAMAAGIALARSFLPKEKHMAALETKGSWPCWGYPLVIIADNAADLNGYVMTTAARRERYDIRNRPVNYPKFGGHIESAFRTVMGGLNKSVEGTKFSNPQERGEYDSNAMATMTLAEFDALFTEWVVNDYHLAEHSGSGMKRRAPLQRWRDGILFGDVFPPVGLPDIPDDFERVFISMLPVEYRVIRNMTVEIFTLIYYSRELSMLSDEIDVNAGETDRKHEIRYDPRNISTIWVRDRRSGEYIAALVQNVAWEHMSLWEHNALKKRLGRPAAELEEQRYQSKLRQDAMKNDSKEKTKLPKADRKRLAQQQRNLTESIVKPTLAAVRALDEESSVKRGTGTRPKRRLSLVPPSSVEPTDLDDLL